MFAQHERLLLVASFGLGSQIATSLLSDTTEGVDNLNWASGPESIPTTPR